MVVGDGGRNPCRALQRPRTGCAVSKQLSKFWARRRKLFERSSRLRCNVPKAEAEKPSVQQRISQTPDFVVAAGWLEKVMEFLQGTTREEVDAIKIALGQSMSCSSREASDRIADCKGFVERAQKWLVKLEAERDAEHTHCSLPCWRRNRNLSCHAATSNTDCRVRSGSGSFPSGQSWLKHVRQWWIPTVTIQTPRGRAAEKSLFQIATRKCQEWMEDRHMNLQKAMVAGRFPKVARALLIC